MLKVETSILKNCFISYAVGWVWVRGGLFPLPRQNPEKGVEQEHFIILLII